MFCGYLGGDVILYDGFHLRRAHLGYSDVLNPSSLLDQTPCPSLRLCRFSKTSLSGQVHFLAEVHMSYIAF